MLAISCPPLVRRLVLVVFAFAACRPDLPVPRDLGAPTKANGISVVLEPEAPLSAAPSVVRVHVGAEVELDEARLFLVRGEVRESHLRQIERDDISKALAARFVPSLVFREDDGSVVLAPTTPLELGETYVVASGEPRAVVELVVEAEATAPLLTRVWPPVEVRGARAFGLFCGEAPLPEGEVPAALAPEGPLGTLARGLAPAGAGGACLRFEGRGQGAADGGPWVPPPVVFWSGMEGPVRLDPRPFGGVEAGGVEAGGVEVGGVEATPDVVPLECSALEVPFGPGCVEVQDDRLLGRGPEAPLLWGIAGEGIDRVMTTSKHQRFVLKGLPAGLRITLDVTTIDMLGVGQRTSFSTTTMAPMPHVVLNEVMANPLGPEPHQEWVELYNDGAVEAPLGELRISDIGGETALPAALLPPGRFAVVVNESFVVDDEVDVPPAEDAMVVRVPALGKSGLANGGEMVRLLDARSRILSRFPAIPKPKAGQSVVRRSPDAPDGVSDSFLLGMPTPGSPNAVSLP